MTDYAYDDGVYAPWYDYEDSITTVQFDGTVTTIGDSAFRECHALTSINIPDGVTTIGNFAFMRSGLESIAIPVSVTAIGDGAFMAWGSGNCVYYAGTEEQWNAITIGIFNFDRSYLPTPVYYNSTGEADIPEPTISYADLDGDGEITVSDASITLTHYAEVAIGGSVTDEILTVSDINSDGVITVDDARYILIYYAEASVGGTPSWDEILTR